MNKSNQTPIIIAILGLVAITLGVLFLRTNTIKQTVSTDRTIEKVAPQPEVLPSFPEEVPSAVQDPSETVNEELAE